MAKAKLTDREFVIEQLKALAEGDAGTPADIRLRAIDRLAGLVGVYEVKQRGEQ